MLDEYAPLTVKEIHERLFWVYDNHPEVLAMVVKKPHEHLLEIEIRLRPIESAHA